MTTSLELSQPGATSSDRPPPGLCGTWTIDPATKVVSFAWRRLRLWTITGRWHCSGVIHLDELPPVGVIRFQQPSGLPVLTITLEPASLEPGDGDRWWRLHSQSLEVLPGGAWRVMATLTTPRTLRLVELCLEVDPEQAARATSKSAVSRRFVAATSKALGELLAATWPSCRWPRSWSTGSRWLSAAVW